MNSVVVQACFFIFLYKNLGHGANLAAIFTAFLKVPLVNLAVSGILSAVIALLFDLEKLVEFMSIGTLLAYTIVSASVIILRYKKEQPSCKPRDGDDESISTASITSDTIDSVGKLKPEYMWLSYFLIESGRSEAISGAVLMFIICSSFLCLHVHFSGASISNGDWLSISTLLFLILCASACLFIIGAHKQNPSANTFRVPWVPLIPGLSILCNVGLMVHLNVLTWIRFAVWMTFGLLVYFFYGIKHSKENDATNSYSMLISSSEANKGFWGSTDTRDDVADKKEKPTDDCESDQ